MKFARLVRHVATPQWVARRAFPEASLAAIEAAVAVTEHHHRSELRFVVEAGLPIADLWRGVSPRERAVDVFSQLRVWDTEENSGVLIYVQLVDRCVEIVADRGVAAKVAPEQWTEICREMEVAFARRDYNRGALSAIDRVGRLLAQHFPAGARNVNELPDRPVVM